MVRKIVETRQFFTFAIVFLSLHTFLSRSQNVENWSIRCRGGSTRAEEHSQNKHLASGTATTNLSVRDKTTPANKCKRSGTPGLTGWLFICIFGEYLRSCLLKCHSSFPVFYSSWHAYNYLFSPESIAVTFQLSALMSYGYCNVNTSTHWGVQLARLLPCCGAETSHSDFAHFVNHR